MKRIEKLVTQIDPTIQKQGQLKTEYCNGVDRPFKGDKVGPQSFGGRLVAQALKEQGVRFVFTLTGGHIAPILVGCNQENINVIDVRDEATTVFAADAQARVSGIPGVAIVTAGPGLTNTVTAVKNAQMAESAVVVFGGATSMLLKGRGSLQDINQFALMKPHTKWCHSIRQVKEIIPVIRKAFRIARSGVPGPVFIEWPLETIWPKDMMSDVSAKEEPPKFEWNTNSLLAYMADAYVRHHVETVFDKAFDPVPPLTMKELVASSSFIDIKENTLYEIATLLSSRTQCEKPVLVIGSQGLLHPTLIPDVVKAIECLNIPCYLSGMARGLLGKHHPLQYRHDRSYALKECDCVLLCGVSVDFRLDYGRRINKKAKLIMVNLSSEKLKQNNDLRAKEITVQGDGQIFLIRLAEVARKLQLKFDYKNWRNRLNVIEQKKEEKIENNAKEKPKNVNQSSINLETESFVHPIRCCRALDQVIDDNSFVIADGGDFVATASYIVRPRKPLRWLDPGAFGTLGCGAGFAMGVKALHPETEVWILFGDGSFGWSVMELDTFKRMKLPVIAVIGNDACWSQMYRDQVRLLKDPVATELEYTHYEKVAQGFGCEGILVRNESELIPSLKKAKEIAKKGTPVVVNIMLSKSSFREGSISL